MTKRAQTILLSLFIVAVSLILLLTFFTFNNKIIKKITPFLLTTNNISIKVGETISNFYQISDKRAELKFYVENPEKININKENITGVIAGETLVKITAKLENKVIESEFKVDIFNKDYKLELSSIVGCEIYQNQIIIKENISQFNFNLYDLKGEEIKDFKYQIFYDNRDILLNDEFGMIQIYTKKDTSIIFNFPTYNYKLTIDINLIN